MSSETPDSSNTQDLKSADIKMSNSGESSSDNSDRGVPPKFSASGISTWAKSLKIPQPFAGSQEVSPSGNSGKSPFSRLTGGLGLRSSPKSPQSEESSGGASPTTQSGFLGTITKGLVDSSKNAVKAVQVKARHVVSQNKRRYQVAFFFGVSVCQKKKKVGHKFVFHLYITPLQAHIILFAEGVI